MISLQVVQRAVPRLPVPGQRGVAGGHGIPSRLSAAAVGRRVVLRPRQATGRCVLQYLHAGLFLQVLV